MLSFVVICIVVGCDELGIGIMMLIGMFGSLCLIFLVRQLFMCRCMLQIGMLLRYEFGWVRYMYLNMYGFSVGFFVYCWLWKLLVLLMKIVLFGFRLCMNLKLMFLIVIDFDVIIYLVLCLVLSLLMQSGWMLNGLWNVSRLQLVISDMIVYEFCRW